MTWIKLNDNAPRHPKISGLSDRCFRAWILSLCYASEFLTNGILPTPFLITVPRKVQDELIAAGLWNVGPPVEIHDYLEHQTSKESVEKERERNRIRRKGDRRDTAGSTSGTTTGSTGENPRPESRGQIQRSDPEIREQQQVPPLRPLISGQSKPLNWGKKHSNHEPEFCNWVCLPDFLFESFRTKSGETHREDGGRGYVLGWARRVRQDWEGRKIGADELKFWRDRWSDSHVENGERTTEQIVEAIEKLRADREAAKVARS